MTAVTRVLVALLLGSGCAKSEPPFEVAGDDLGTTTTDHGHSDGAAIDLAADLATSPDAGKDVRDDADVGDGESPAVRRVASTCPMTAVSGGTDWDGWANLQYPDRVTIDVGEVSEPIFGQTWQVGVTDQPGVAPGWEAQLVVGPLGVNPETEPECFRVLDAEYNVDDGNNDEWWVRLRVDKPGLWNMYYRFRPSGGTWRYGDLNGTDDGVSTDQAGVLVVEDPAGPDELRAVTLNLRCRVDDWAAREELVVRALVAIDPHIVSFQEDCSVPGGPSQSSELAARLSAQLDRGYSVRRSITHDATYPEGTFSEGIALLSALPIRSNQTVDLPFANFPRRAIVADVSLGDGDSVRVISTHMEFGGANDGVRDEEAATIVSQVQGPTIVLGDLNTDPDDTAYTTFDAALDDVWAVAGSGDGYTIPSNAPSRRIDYIWFNGLTAQSADVVREEDNGVYLSDHLGVEAVFVRE